MDNYADKIELAETMLKHLLTKGLEPADLIYTLRIILRDQRDKFELNSHKNKEYTTKQIQKINKALISLENADNALR